MLASVVCVKATLAGAAVNSARLFVELDLNQDGQVAGDEIESRHRRLFERMLRQADADGDGKLSCEEFAVALTPRSPKKPIVTRQSEEFPGAAAAELLLLKMDTNQDARIEPAEVPIELLDAFDQLVERMDRNNDDRLTRFELARGGAERWGLAQRFARLMDFDVENELAGYRRKQGQKANRFAEAPRPEQILGNPLVATELFAQLDANADGLVQEDEVPQPIRERFSRLLRLADRNEDGALTEREFVEGAQRVARFIQRMEAP